MTNEKGERYTWRKKPKFRKIGNQKIGKSKGWPQAVTVNAQKQTDVYFENCTLAMHSLEKLISSKLVPVGMRSPSRVLGRFDLAQFCTHGR